MNSSAKEALLRLSGELAELSQDLERPPDTLEQLKFVLQKIADIRDISVEVEMQYRDIQVPCVSLCPQVSSGVGLLGDRWRVSGTSGIILVYLSFDISTGVWRPDTLHMLLKSGAKVPLVPLCLR